MMRWARAVVRRALTTTMTLFLAASISTGAGTKTFDGVLKGVDADSRRIVVLDRNLARPLELGVPKGAQIRLGPRSSCSRRCLPGLVCGARTTRRPGKLHC